MVNSFRFLFCTLACFFSINAYSAERTDYRDWTPEKAQKVIERRDADFAKLGKDIAYARDYASGKMDNIVNQINNEHQVRTMIRDSGIDPDTGKKIRIEANVTQAANKAKVASTLADRLKKAADYAKKTGKASIPAFVGGAAVQALVDGVGWVMDEGGQVKKPFVCESGQPCTTAPKIYTVNGGKFYTGSAACASYESQYMKNLVFVPAGSQGFQIDGCTFTYTSNGNNGRLGLTSQQNPTYDPNATDSERKTVPLVNIGSQVLDQAETEVKTGNPAVPIATPVTQAAATAVIGEAATDEVQARPITAELDKSAAIPTTETALGEIAPPTTNPDTGEVKPGSISLDFPVFCSWAPSMCVLADKVQEAIIDARDWATSEPQQKDPENLEFEDLEIDASEVNLSASSTCPQDSVSFSVMGKSVTLDMPYQPVCDALNFFKPAVLLVGAVASVYIVAGVRTKEEDQP